MSGSVWELGDGRWGLTDTKVHVVSTTIVTSGNSCEEKRRSGEDGEAPPHCEPNTMLHCRILVLVLLVIQSPAAHQNLIRPSGSRSTQRNVSTVCSSILNTSVSPFRFPCVQLNLTSHIAREIPSFASTGQAARMKACCSASENSTLGIRGTLQYKIPYVAYLRLRMLS